MSAPPGRLRAHVAAVLRPLVGGLPRTFWVLWLGTLVNRLGTFILPFLALYLTGERGFTVERAGLVASLYGAGAVVAGPLGGMLADRVGRRLTVAGGLWLGAGAMLLLGFCREPVHIFGAAFLLGVVGELYRPAFFAIISDVVQEVDRPRAYGLLYWVLNVSTVVSMPLAGFMSRQGFQLLFILDACTTFIYGMVIWVLVPETRPSTEGVRQTPAEVGSMLTPFRNLRFVGLVVPIFATTFILCQGGVALPVDLESRGMDPAMFGTVMAVNGLIISVGEPLLLRATVRVRRMTLLAWGAVFTGAGFGLHSLSASAGLAAVAVGVWTLGEMIQSPVAPAVVADLSPVDARGSYQGAFHMVWGLATCVAPALGGQVLGRHGAFALWMGCLGLGLLAAVWYLVFGALLRRQVRPWGEPGAAMEAPGSGL
ncbi:MDR family MFS transporter [Myxococcus sp. CA051A]|uniref:MDR family MFS transporter n=1 Tax=Myxococcus sp. CA051A TaxID=2741739 RepID=UPI0035303576